MESRRSNSVLILRIDHDKCSSGFQRFLKEDFEDIFFITVTLRMLFPDERIGRNSKKIIPIFRPERTKLDKFAS